MFISLMLLGLVSLAPCLDLPALTGPAPAGTVTPELIDYSRLDPSPQLPTPATSWSQSSTPSNTSVATAVLPPTDPSTPNTSTHRSASRQGQPHPSSRRPMLAPIFTPSALGNQILPSSLLVMASRDWIIQLR